MFEAPAGAQIKRASGGAAAAELLAAPEAVRVFGRSDVPEAVRVFGRSDVPDEGL